MSQRPNGARVSASIVKVPNLPVVPLFLLAHPDGCTRGETVFDPRNGEIIVQVPLS